MVSVKKYSTSQEQNPEVSPNKSQASKDEGGIQGIVSSVMTESKKDFERKNTCISELKVEIDELISKQVELVNC